MRDKEYSSIEKVIQRGRWRYILFYGVLQWGLGTAVLFSLFKILTDSDQTAISIGLIFVIFPAFGALYGMAMWGHIKKQYYKENTDSM